MAEPSEVASTPPLAPAPVEIPVAITIAAAAEPDFAAFFRAEFPAMVALATSLTGDRAAGEDIAAEALSRAYRRWDTVGTYDRPGAWCRRVAINLATSRRRRLAREVRARMRLGVRTDTADDDPATSGRAAFDALIAPLPPRQRAAVLLRYVDGYPIDDIATAMGCAPGTVKAHLHAARAAIAEEAER